MWITQRALYIVPTALFVALVAIADTAAQQRTINDFFNDFTAEWIRTSPNLAVADRYFTGAEQDRLEQQLTPDTPEYRRSRVLLAKQGLDGLKKFNRSAMTPLQQISADLMRWQLETIVEGESFLDYSFPLEQFGGANVQLVATLTVNHPLRAEKDAVNYIARLRLVGKRMNESAENARRLIGKGMFPPKFILNATITQMRQFIASPPSQNPFVATFAERMASIKEIPPARREELRAQAVSIVIDDVYPAWRQAIAVLEPAVARATDDAGLWRYKDGGKAYAYFLKRFTSTNLTADQIHQIGLQQVARIEKEMDRILRQLGRTEGSVKERVENLK